MTDNIKYNACMIGNVQLYVATYFYRVIYLVVCIYVANLGKEVKINLFLHKKCFIFNFLAIKEGDLSVQ